MTIYSIYCNHVRYSVFYCIVIAPNFTPRTSQRSVQGSSSSSPGGPASCPSSLASMSELSYRTLALGNTGRAIDWFYCNVVAPLPSIPSTRALEAPLKLPETLRSHSGLAFPLSGAGSNRISSPSRFIPPRNSL